MKTRAIITAIIAAASISSSAAQDLLTDGKVMESKGSFLTSTSPLVMLMEQEVMSHKRKSEKFMRGAIATSALQAKEQEVRCQTCFPTHFYIL